MTPTDFHLLRLACALVLVTAADTSVAAAVYTASEVVGYSPGAGVQTNLTAPVASLGLPSAATGTNAWDGNFSPFNSHYDSGEIVQVGEGGSLTLRLERFVHPSPGVPSLGVWENVFLLMGSDGRVGVPAAVFGSDSASVEASADGIAFYPVGFFNFDWFGNYWTDSLGPYDGMPGTIRADFGRPHGRNLADFSGVDYGTVLSLLGGSGGGTWIDLSTSGLQRVGWIRFRGVPAGSTLEIDAVTINTSLAGAPTAVPTLRIEMDAGGARIVLPNSLAHASYQLQRSTNFAQGWQDLGTAAVGKGGDLVFTDATVPRPPQSFYRVVMP